MNPIRFIISLTKVDRLLLLIALQYAVNEKINELSKAIKVMGKK